MKCGDCSERCTCKATYLYRHTKFLIICESSQIKETCHIFNTRNQLVNQAIIVKPLVLLLALVLTIISGCAKRPIQEIPTLPRPSDSSDGDQSIAAKTNDNSRIVTPSEIDLTLSTADISVVEREMTSISRSVIQPITTINDDQGYRVSKKLLEPFRIQYRTRIKLGWIKLDVNATRSLERITDNEWEIRFDATASLGQIKEYSRFRLVDDVIEPIIYRRRASGLIDQYNRTLQFDHSSKYIIDLETNQPLPLKWHTGIQNDLTYMLQIAIDLKKNKQTFSYPVLRKDRIRTMNFGISGEEKITTQAGILNTLKISQMREDDKEVEAWLTNDDKYSFVRLLDRKNGEVRYRIDAVNIES